MHMFEHGNSLALMGLGMNELLIILLIAMLVFGATRIPEIARSLGKSIREFKKGTSEDTESESDKNTTQPEDKPKT